MQNFVSYIYHGEKEVASLSFEQMHDLRAFAQEVMSYSLVSLIDLLLRDRQEKPVAIRRVSFESFEIYLQRAVQGRGDFLSVLFSAYFKEIDEMNRLKAELLHRHQYTIIDSDRNFRLLKISL